MGLKVVKVSEKLYNTVNKSGNEYEPFYVKMDRMLSPKEAPKKPRKKHPAPSKLGPYFKKMYEETFGHPYPSWGARESSQIKYWGKSMTEKQAFWCIDKYMGWTKYKAVESGHSLGVLVTSHVELVTDFKRGLNKQVLKDTHKDQKREVESHASIRRRRTQDSSYDIGSVGEIQNSAKKELSGPSERVFGEQEAFAIPSGVDMPDGSEEA